MISSVSFTNAATSLNLSKELCTSVLCMSGDRRSSAVAAQGVRLKQSKNVAIVNARRLKLFSERLKHGNRAVKVSSNPEYDSTNSVSDTESIASSYRKQCESEIVSGAISNGSIDRRQLVDPGASVQVSKDELLLSFEDLPTFNTRSKNFGQYYSNGNGKKDLVPVFEDSDRNSSMETTQVELLDSQSDEGADKDLLGMMKLVLGFAGPALVIWFSSPLMSLIDTAVVGRGSSLELAALGPGAIVCDNIAFLFTFLSVATSNLIATAMAHQDYEAASLHLSQLLFVALTCGIMMIGFTFTCAPYIIRDFVGKNTALIPAAMTYATIRGLAWPAVLIQSVAQSTCLGMQDTWGPLVVLVISSLLNLFGDIFLCSFLGMGIAGAAWATMASQYVGCFLMLYSIHNAGKLRLSMSVPSLSDFVGFIKLAAPIFMTTVSKTSFYAVLTRVAATMGNATSGAHQVMIGLFSLCAVCGEPLSSTAQTYIPSYREGRRKNLKQARLLLWSLIIAAVSLGSLLALVTAVIPWKFPFIFTNDIAIVNKMRSVTVPLVFSLLLMPVVLSLEGTLMGGRDMKFMAASMAISFTSCACFVTILQNLKFGLLGSWWALAAFQSSRVLQAAIRLASSKSVLREASLSEARD